MIGLTIVASILTYFIFENPIRKIKSRKIVLVLLIIMVLIGIWSYMVLRGRKITSNIYDEEHIEEILIEAEKGYIPR